MYVLTDTHAPQNHRRFGRRKLSCHFTQGLCRNAANWRHSFRAITFDIFFEGFKVVSAIGNKIFVCQAFFDDCVDHGIEHCHIGIRLELHHAPSMFTNFSLTWITQHNFGAPFCGILKPCRCYWMISGGIGSNQHNQARVLDIIDLVTHSTRTNTL